LAQDSNIVLFRRRSYRSVKGVAVVSSEAASRMAKIFLGGISPNTTKESIEEYFCRYGIVTDAVAMMQNGVPRGFGFVTFEDHMAAQAVLDEAGMNQHELDGKGIEVKSAVPKGDDKGGGKGGGCMGGGCMGGGCMGGGCMQQRNDITDKVFVGGLAATVTEDELIAYFSQYGNLIDSVVMKDKMTGKPKGFGFCQYDNTESVDLVMQDFENHQLGGKWCEVKRAVPKDRMPASSPQMFAGGKMGGGKMGGGKMGGGKMGGGKMGGGFGKPSQAPHFQQQHFQQQQFQQQQFAPQGAFNPMAPPGQRFGGGGGGCGVYGGGGCPMGGKAFGGKGGGFRPMPY